MCRFKAQRGWPSECLPPASDESGTPNFEVAGSSLCYEERGAPAAGRFLEELQRLALRVNMIHLNTEPQLQKEAGSLPNPWNRQPHARKNPSNSRFGLVFRHRRSRPQWFYLQNAGGNMA